MKGRNRTANLPRDDDGAGRSAENLLAHGAEVTGGVQSISIRPHALQIDGEQPIGDVVDLWNRRRFGWECVRRAAA